MSKQEARAQRINEWLEHLQRWEAAGGSLASYAREHGLALWALYNWRSVLTQEGRRQPKKATLATPREPVPLQFARVTLAETPMASYVVRLRLGNGRCAEIELTQIDPLIQLIRGLEQPR